MKVSQFVEALECAAREYKRKTKKDMEIFDLDYDHEDGILIDACSEVAYTNDSFMSSKNGSKPLARVLIQFEIEDEKIDDRSVEVELE